MKISLTFILLVICAPYCSFASGSKLQLEEREIRFTPHISGEAFTRKQWSWAFSRSVGSNINTSFLLGSLSVAVSDRVEIGTSLFHYFLENHEINFSLKYNLWRTNQFLWSFGFNTAVFKVDQTDFPDSLKDPDIRLNLNSFQTLFNYLPKNSKYKFGANLNYVSVSFSNFDEDSNNVTIESVVEFGVDVSRSFTDKYDITIGLGNLRDEGVSADEESLFGFGTSVRMYRPNKFLSSPTLGVHFTPDSKATALLLSSSIY